jgi:ABC-type Na+ efflux pump permease subunit
MSLYVMQANWNGLYLDEPRFRIPLNLAIVGVLLQVGLSFIPDAGRTSLANIAYAAALFASMNSAQAVLHPESPIFRSDAQDIQVFFVVMLILLVLAVWQLALGWLQWERMKHDAG